MLRCICFKPRTMFYHHTICNCVKTGPTEGDKLNVCCRSIWTADLIHTDQRRTHRQRQVLIISKYRNNKKE